jgi:hypothetical protein
MSFTTGTGNDISIGNSTAALLASGATFTGVWEDVTNYTTIASSILGSLATDGTIYFDLSTDGGATFTSVPSNVSDATFAVPRIINAAETHVRIRYVNGTTAQTGTFSIQTKYSNGQQMALFSSVDGFINGETPTQVVRSIIVGEDDDDVYRNVRTTRAGDMAVAISDADLGFHAIVTPGGSVKVSEQTHLVGEPFGNATLNTTKWSIDLVGSGSQDSSIPGELTMDTGTTANSAVEIQSTDIARFIPANYNTTHHAVTIPDGASYAADNSRKWGAFDATNAASGNGIYFEIDNGDWYTVHCINGVPSRTIQADWNGLAKATFPLNSTSANVYEIEYNAGSIIFRVNGGVMHRETLLGTPYADDIHFPAGMSNTNYNGSIVDVSMKLRAAVIYTLGKGTGQDRPYFISGTTAGLTIKSGPGHLGRIIFARDGGGGGAATIAIYDALSATNQVAAIVTKKDETEPVEFDFTFNTGLFVTITGAGTLSTTITFD